MSIGQRIKTMRIQQGLSVDDLAYKLGKNRTTVYRYETGDIENLPLGILDSLADALNTTPAYLMGWTTDNTEVQRVNQWNEEFSAELFSDEEYKKIVEYGKFLISQRR